MSRTPSSPADPAGARRPPSPAADRLWVVLPVFDEAASIERVIAEWIPALERADPDFVLLAVDDGSTDDTPAILDRLGRTEPRLRVVRQANRGHGPACMRGYEHAVSAASDARWVLQIDSDGQCDPGDFAAFWEARHEHLCQLGRRRRRGDGRLRGATSRVLSWLVSLAAGRRVRDPNVPFRLLRRDVLARALERLRAAPDVELANAALAVVLARQGAVRWVDIGFRERLAGRSHYRAGRMARLALGVLRWIRSAEGGREPVAAPVLSSGSRAARAAALLAWCALAAAVALYALRNVPSEALWFDEAVQVHTSLGLSPLGKPFLPSGTLRDVVVRNASDQLDPGGYGVLLHVWIRLFGTAASTLHVASGLLSLCGLAALALLARRWIAHPLAPPAAVALALADPLVREHAIEVRPYALELAGVWLAFWAADRLLERPGPARGALLGLVLVALLGSRYSAFLTVAALAGAVALELWPLAARDRERRRPWALAAAFLPPFLGVVVIARYSIPGLVRRASWNDGAMVEYFDAHKLGAQGFVEAVATALRNLAHPDALGLTVAALLAIGPGLLSTAAPAARSTALVRRAALFVLLLTVVLWRWHPWDPAVKWSFYLRLIATVCVVRFAAEVWPRLARRAATRRAAAIAALGLVAYASVVFARHERWRWDVAIEPLDRVRELVGDAEGLVAVDPHPMAGLRYHYEFGALRGRPEYPRAFVLPLDGQPIAAEAMCRVRWLLSFDSIRRIEERYPELRFEEDLVADQLLLVRAADGAELGGCGSESPAGEAITRGSSGVAR